MLHTSPITRNVCIQLVVNWSHLRVCSHVSAHVCTGEKVRKEGESKNREMEMRKQEVHLLTWLVLTIFSTSTSPTAALDFFVFRSKETLWNIKEAQQQVREETPESSVEGWGLKVTHHTGVCGFFVGILWKARGSVLFVCEPISRITQTLLEIHLL